MYKMEADQELIVSVRKNANAKSSDKDEDDDVEFTNSKYNNKIFAHKYHNRA